MTNRSFLFITFCSAVLMLLAGCAEDPPNAIGLGILPGKDSLKVSQVTFSAITSGSRRDRIPGSSASLLLGRSQGIEARMLLRFNVTAAEFPNVRIDSAVLHLKPGYRFKDSTGLLEFTVQLANSTTWNQNNFLWDSIGAGFINDTVAGRFSRTITASDTDIAVRIDTSILRKWVTNSIGSVILIPSASSTIIAGIENTGVMFATPRFVFAYHDSLDSAHTVTASLAASEYVANADIPVNNDRIILQSGVAGRGRVMFDVSSIPTNATITDAALEVQIDSSLSLFGPYRRDTLLAHLNLSTSSDSLGFGTLGIPDSTRRKISFQVNTIVQKWVTKQFANNGFVLRNYTEFVGAERIALFGASDTTRRPVLRIRYTLIP